jgi:diguanylate cyclase (GGDEF)-like protein
MKSSVSSDPAWSPPALRRRAARCLQRPLIEDPTERRFGGRVGGMLWIGGGVVVLLPRLLGGAPRTLPLGIVVALAGIAFLWGALSVWRLDWVDGPPWLTHLTALGGLTTLTLVVYLTGDGVRSPGWNYFTWLALYGCFFYRRRAAIGYLVLCLAAQGGCLLLHPAWDLKSGYGWQLALVIVGYGSVGVALIRGKELLTRLRQRAERAADTDAMTGLGNHRRMDRALSTAAVEFARTGGTFAVAVIDVDHLKRIRDVRGHDTTDAALVELAVAMGEIAEPDDVLARTGGDEFTWLMPRTCAGEAKRRVDAVQARLAVARRSYPLRFSAGICDTQVTRDPSLLVQLAEGALYWAKLQGRNRSQIYDPAVIEVLSAQERAEMLERSQTLIGLQALARAIDAKDPATQQHSERVAVVAEGLARVIGWDESRAHALHDAALVHDVGKIGIDDAVLRKAASLTDAERNHVRSHTLISARIAAGILAPEQVDWIRTHHERADGSGYPLGLTAAEIPTGGALLAIADAYDAMTAGRPYSERRDPLDALAECQAAAGRHFSYEAVDALERWLTATTDRTSAAAPVHSD